MTLEQRDQTCELGGAFGDDLAGFGLQVLDITGGGGIHVVEREVECGVEAEVSLLIGRRFIGQKEPELVVRRIGLASIITLMIGRTQPSAPQSLASS